VRSAVVIAAVLLVAQSALADCGGWLDKPLLSLAPLPRCATESTVVVPLSVTIRPTSN